MIDQDERRREREGDFPENPSEAIFGYYKFYYWHVSARFLACQELLSQNETHMIRGFRSRFFPFALFPSLSSPIKNCNLFQTSHGQSSAALLTERAADVASYVSVFVDGSLISVDFKTEPSLL